MDEVTKDMDDKPEGPIVHQGHPIGVEDVDDDLIESTAEDTATSILGHVGDIIFQHSQTFSSDVRNRLGDPKTPDSLMSPREYETINKSLNSSMLHTEVISPVIPTKTVSSVQFQASTEWQPSCFFHDEYQESAFFRIAADGAGNRLLDISKDPTLRDLIQSNLYQLDVICGDLDSLEANARQSFESRGTRIVRIKDQDSTDFQKCTSYLREKVFTASLSPSNILCLGGLGGRVDQGLSQLHQLYKEQRSYGYKNGRIYLLSTEAVTFVLLSGKHHIHVRDKTVPPLLGKHIGIIPLKEPSVITTKGLEWDVTDWKTEFGGQMSTSNLVREDVVEVATSHDILFTIDLDLTSTENVS